MLVRTAYERAHAKSATMKEQTTKPQSREHTLNPLEFWLGKSHWQVQWDVVLVVAGGLQKFKLVFHQDLGWRTTHTSEAVKTDCKALSGRPQKHPCLHDRFLLPSGLWD